jgi:hypothetical protein
LSIRARPQPQFRNGMENFHQALRRICGFAAASGSGFNALRAASGKW